MSEDIRPRIRLPQSARRGEVVEIKLLVQHAMESGQRRGADGALVPRKILNTMHVRYGGKDVLTAKLEAAIAANPFFSFHLRAESTGPVEFTWIDDDGREYRAREQLKVVG